MNVKYNPFHKVVNIAMTAEDAAKLAGVLGIVVDNSEGSPMDKLYNGILDEGIEAHEVAVEPNESYEDDFYNEPWSHVVVIN